METPAIKEPGAEKIPADMIVQNLLLTSLLSSPFNPRGKYSRDPEKLKELAADIKVHGVQQAILVRPDGAGKYEIVFGTRRVEASKIAGKETVPAVIRELSAEEAMTLAMVENLQRTDIHFMEEAAGFKKLLSGGVTPKVVGEMVGKPEVYVHLRMALNNLNPKWMAEAYHGELLLGPALHLARLPVGAQWTVWKEFAQYDGRTEEGHYSAVSLQRFIERHVMTVLTAAPFPTDSADLVPAAGSCTACPKRSGASPMLFADIKETDTCTDAECYGSKCRAYLVLRKKELPDAVEIASTVGLDYSDRDQLSKKKVTLPRREYEKGGWTESLKDSCEHTKQGLIVAGIGLGKIKYICAVEDCKVHGARRSAGGHVVKRVPGMMNEERKKQVEELWQRRTDGAIRLAVHAAVRAVQAKAKDAFASIPLEAFRFIVKECAYALQPMQDGVKYFEGLWLLPKGVKASNDYRSGHLDKLIHSAPDRATLLKILGDLTVAQDVAGKFSQGEKIEELAKAYLVPIKKVSEPVKKEWDEKKRASYEKRDKRLAGELASAKKKAGAGKKEKVKVDPKMWEATKAKLKEQAEHLAADQEKTKARTIGNMCRYCGCVDDRSCLIDGVPCSWIVKPKKVKGKIIAGVCSNPECVAKYKAI